MTRIAALVEACEAARDGLNRLTTRRASLVTHREAVVHGGLEHSIDNSVLCPACHALALLDAALHNGTDNP